MTKRRPCICRTPTTKRTSRSIFGCTIPMRQSGTTFPVTANPRASIARLAFTRWSTRTRRVTKALASSSTRKIASIAKLATSRTRRKTSIGPRRKVGVDRTIRICEWRFRRKIAAFGCKQGREGFSFGCSVRLKSSTLRPRIHAHCSPADKRGKSENMQRRLKHCTPAAAFLLAVEPVSCEWGGLGRRDPDRTWIRDVRNRRQPTRQLSFGSHRQRGPRHASRRKSTTARRSAPILEIPISLSARSLLRSPMATNRTPTRLANGSSPAIRTTVWRALQLPFTTLNKDNSRLRALTWRLKIHRERGM